MSIEDQLARAQQQLHDCAAKIHNQRAEIVRLEKSRRDIAGAFERLHALYWELHNAVADPVTSHTQCVEMVRGLRRTVDEQRRRLAVKCEHPSAASCARLWQEEANQLQLAGVSPVLAEEFPFGCDTVEHLATALLASRNRHRRLLELHREICDELYGQGLEVAGFHLNGDLEPLDSWFDDNGWLDAETWRPAEKAGEA